MPKAGPRLWKNASRNLWENKSRFSATPVRRTGALPPKIRDGNHIPYIILKTGCYIYGFGMRPQNSVHDVAKKIWSMGLSAEKKKSLKALYDTWGLDKVRRDLERHYYPSLLSSDVSAFERAWVAAKEAQGRRRNLFIKALLFIFFSLFAGIVAAFLAF
ncbi:MAG: hypothetical protein O3C49_03055 [Proteobacteria bacterium]|nr:hypothetical protein [Pseudomonadota bacterium]MDA1326011.1 hypothetical protein [Pseudomonadota bacterium]